MNSIEREAIPYTIHTRIKELGELFNQKYKKRLPPNMIEAMVLYLDSLYKTRKKRKKYSKFN